MRPDVGEFGVGGIVCYHKDSILLSFAKRFKGKSLILVAKLIVAPQ